jgi:4-hydroxy-tetrahydrodipicolinate reductase
VRIAIHGYGKMGKAVEKVAREAKHETVVLGRDPRDVQADVIIDFSHADALDGAVDLACSRKIPLVIGTTGWNDRIDSVRTKIEKAGIAAVYASNFSPGAQVTFAVARRAGELFARFPQYAAGMEERHHAQKKDAPSGTALRIAREVKEGSGGKLDPTIAFSRIGNEFGLHTLFFDSPDDLIEISHRARGREGFARGALMAAEMLRGRKGLIRFEEMVMS